GIPRHLLDGYLPGNVHNVFFIATKTAKSSCDHVPQQKFYETLWRGSADQSSRDPSALTKFKELIKSKPVLDLLVRQWGLTLIRASTILQSRRRLRRISKRY